MFLNCNPTACTPPWVLFSGSGIRPQLAMKLTASRCLAHGIIPYQSISTDPTGFALALGWHEIPPGWCSWPARSNAGHCGPIGGFGTSCQLCMPSCYILKKITPTDTVALQASDVGEEKSTVSCGDAASSRCHIAKAAR